MYRKLDNDTWEEYLNKFNSIKDTITVKDFCAENNLNKSQFYYHKKRVQKVIESKETIFQAISLNSKVDNIKENKSTLKEVTINVGNANILIPVSEATLITSIIKKLILKC
ncbi:hypothetical protein RBU49_09755 [Clostridium sp. MB40-C1]|uniref:IS66 family insertion sequence element accessory protein TnpA n=1 Tax=Clostridium sp. MB40-C1 TaxID=3070996 RepID=UPI0027DFE545|nr:hypothetical protein [Clostridium sp. MB40-C1]WMJ79175.1 hypothetical protein RBU49_09755 [Clostridium sp. MB40-C1]